MESIFDRLGLCFYFWQLLGLLCWVLNSEWCLQHGFSCAKVLEFVTPKYAGTLETQKMSLCHLLKPLLVSNIRDKNLTGRRFLEDPTLSLSVAMEISCFTSLSTLPPPLSDSQGGPCPSPWK